MISLLIAALLLAPAYVLKFHLLSLPTNVLMVWVFLLWLIFFIYLLLKKQVSQFLTAVRNWDRSILIFVLLFLLSGIISLFVKGATLEKLGQFIVLFLQPISMIFIGNFLIQKSPNTKYYLLNAIYFSLALSGLYAILQYFSLWGLPQAFWGNSMEPKRAVSFFIHPNFYALWSAPLLALLIPDVFSSLKSKLVNLKSILWLFGAIGLLLSLSRAGWLGLGAAVLVYLIVATDKKIRKLAGVIVIILVIVIVSIPNLRWRFTLPLYGEKSAVSRLSLWNTGWKAIYESPILGLGLTGFSQNWEKLNTDPGLTDTHNFPHNIFLDLWVETGLLGLLSFIGLLWVFIKTGVKNRRDIFKLGVALFLITIIFQGLIDNPYFKNDLAMVFWIILSLIL
ncbi:MAG: O-antigen ligase family protein [Patescibacteria group bacterium]